MLNDHNEEMQEMWVRIKCKTKHFPFNDSHQQALIKNMFEPKGITLQTGDDNKLFILI